MDAMKIVTWNVNSLKAREAFVGLYLDREQPDVLALQELKLDTDAVPVDLFTSRGYHVAMHAQPTWNGVLIASREPLEDVHRGLEGYDEGHARMVAATSAGIRWVNLYCPQGQTVDSDQFPYKLRFYDGLIAWLGDDVDPSRPAMVLGDLNVAREARDVYDPERFADVPTFHPEEHARWDRLLALGFADVVRPHVPPQTYSFWDYRGGAFHRKRGMRIDHILCTPPLAERVTGATIQRDWRKVQVDPNAPGDAKAKKLKPSDHAPVVAYVERGG